MGNLNVPASPVISETPVVSATAASVEVDKVEEIEEVVEVTATPAPSESDVKDWEAEAIKWQALSRKNETASKANFAKVKELETSLTAANASVDISKDLATANASLLRRLVASEFGLPEALRDRLQGDTEEALRADAEILGRFATPAAEQPKQKPVALQGNINHAIGATPARSAKEWIALQK